MAGKRVLLIDDSDDIREVAKLSLETFGAWTVFTAGTGTRGLAVAAEERPDAILLDVMMPDLDGPTTLRLLQADSSTSDIPVVFLTGKTQAHEHDRLRELGARGVLTKPFSALRLSEDLLGALGWSS